MQNGVGVFLCIDMVATTHPNPTQKEYIDIVVDLNKTIPPAYKDGIHFIVEAINHYYPHIKSVTQSNTLSLQLNQIETSLAHYQVESFLGATVLWIQQYFKIDIPDAKYRYDGNERKFIFELM